MNKKLRPSLVLVVNFEFISQYSIFDIQTIGEPFRFSIFDFRFSIFDLLKFGVGYSVFHITGVRGTATVQQYFMYSIIFYYYFLLLLFYQSVNT
jgi:hypothetical protein